MARLAGVNRFGLGLVGLVALAAGAAGLARGLDWWPDVLGEAQVPVLDEQVRDFAARDWFWPAVAAALVIVALLALWWLAIQSQRRTLKSLRLEPDPRRGGTALPARAVTGAFTDDLSEGAELRRVRARLVRDRGVPRLAVSATLPPEADPATAREQVYRALGRHRQALEVTDLPATLELR